MTYLECSIPFPDYSYGNGRIDHSRIYLIDITNIDKIRD